MNVHEVDQGLERSRANDGVVVQQQDVLRALGGRRFEGWTDNRIVAPGESLVGRNGHDIGPVGPGVVDDGGFKFAHSIGPGAVLADAHLRTGDVRNLVGHRMQAIKSHVGQPVVHHDDQQFHDEFPGVRRPICRGPGQRNGRCTMHYNAA